MTSRDRMRTTSERREIDERTSRGTTASDFPRTRRTVVVDDERASDRPIESASDRPTEIMTDRPTDLPPSVTP